MKKYALGKSLGDDRYLPNVSLPGWTLARKTCGGPSNYATFATIHLSHLDSPA